MARLWQGGAELNSITSGVEVSTNSGITISSSTVHSGSFSWQANTSSTTAFASHNIFITNQNTHVFLRAYIYFVSFPTNITEILRIAGTTGGRQAGIEVGSNGVLGLINIAGTLVGSGSSALNLNQWYRVELELDASLNPGSVAGYVDGVQFASGANTAQGSWAHITFGVITPSTTANMFFDDLAVNDTSGTSQNGLPGNGKIIHLRPNAAGDANSFAVQVGGTAGSANNYTRVDEVIPDDATSYNGSTILNQEDLFNVTDSGIGSSDVVNTVMVGARFANLVGSDTTAGFQLEIMKASGGTKSKSANIVPHTTAWSTNAGADPRNYPIILYQDPDGNNWTQTTLDTMQIGYVIDVAHTRTNAISTVWASVDYAVAPAFTISTTDSTVLSESLNYYSDLVNINEQVYVATADTLNVSDTATTSENTSLTLILTINVSDSTATSENLSFTGSTSLSVSDITFTGDAAASFINATTTYAPNVNDSTTTSESIGIMAEARPIISDTTATSENIQFDSFSSISVSDSTAASESIAVPIVDVVNVNDVATTSENLLLTSEYNVTTSDTTTTSENIQLAGVNTIAVSDSTSASESTITQESFAKSVSDSTAISENVVLSEQINITVNDSVIVAESSIVIISSTVEDFITTSDTATTSDSAHYYSDLVIINDKVSIASVDTIHASDTATTSESVSFAITESISVSDTINSSESVSFQLGFIFFDTVTITESLNHYSDQVDVHEFVSITVINPPRSVTASDTTTASEFMDITRNGSRDITLVDNRLLDENGNAILDQNGNFIFDETGGSDIVTTAENSNVQTITTISTNDSTTASENVKLLNQEFITTSDVVATQENLGFPAVINLQVTVHDNIATSEFTGLFNVDRDIHISDTVSIEEHPEVEAPDVFVEVKSFTIIMKPITMAVVIPETITFKMVVK